MVRLSKGTAIATGLSEARTDVLPTTAYMMVGGRCSFNCAFCAQARGSKSRSDALSRVTWPEHEEEAALVSVRSAYETGAIKRACLQVTASADYFAETKRLISKVHKACGAPVCASISPVTMGQIAELLEAGADRIGLSLDAACERVFDQIKRRLSPVSVVDGSTEEAGQPDDRAWRRTLALIEEASIRFPGHISTHLIIGLGETEEEAVQTIQKLCDWGATVGLFAFTPVRGTAMESQSPPSIGSYRRVQVGSYLMKNGLSSVGNFRFDRGQIVHFGLEPGKLAAALGDGKAFETSGCPDCNRPYYNEKPGGVMYNYPRPLTQAEVERALLEVWDGVAVP